MRIVVLFNLLPGVDPAEYEAWARGSDIPGELKTLDGKVNAELKKQNVLAN